MKTLFNIIPLFAVLATCCTPRESEQTVIPASERTVLSAYMADTKTAYSIDEGAKKAVFSWAAGDMIDVLVNTGSNVQPIAFATEENGPSVTFRDGVATGAATVESLKAQYPASEPNGWAFYPSKSDAKAQNGSYDIDWFIGSGSPTVVILRNTMNYIPDNPLSVVPLFGMKDGEGNYAFSPLTAVLAITVSGLPADADFISISSDSAVLGGIYELQTGAGFGELSLDHAQGNAGGSVTINFSKLEGTQTFYFPVPSGTLPAGLVIKCGNSTDPSGQMSLTTTGPVNLVRGRIARSQAIPFNASAPAEDWVSMGKARFVDDLIWEKNGFPPYYSEVEVWQDSGNPNRYRVENPYAVAIKAFRLTANGETDEYMYLTVDPSTLQVLFGSVRMGMTRNDFASTRNLALADSPTWESIKTSGGSVSAASSKVASGTASAPQEIQLYGAYYDSDDITYFFTNNTGIKHLYFPAYYEAETWADFAEGTYQDVTYDKNINGSSAIGTVPVTIQRSTSDVKRYRIANPYRGVVESSYLRSTYDEYLYFSTGFGGLVFFETFRPGLAMNPSVNMAYELGIAHPVSSNLLGYSQGSSDFSGSSVLETKSDGSPARVQLGAHYYDIAGPTPGYCYTRHGSAWPDDRIYISFTPSGGSSSGGEVTVEHQQIPVRAQFHNPVAFLDIPSGTLEKLVIKITASSLSGVKGINLWHGGWMASDYVAPDANGVVTMTSFTRPEISGTVDLNFWIDEVTIGTSYRFDVQEIVVSGVSYPVVQDNTIAHTPGVIMNNGGDVENVRGSSETVASFRIPALVTSNAGTLIAAYDVRYAHSGDLQADIDVGMKRSTDGGKTWSALKLIMDMGEYGGLAQNQNGIGDPCLLVDETTGRIFCFAVWTHGHLNDPDTRSLFWAAKGYEIAETPQFMMVYSDDDGITWTDPINITYVKQADWRMTFQGPGRGITMKDGTLVVPIQHQEGESKTMHGTYPLNSGIMYSQDHGATWHATNYAHTVTSECAVAEIEPGVLMLSMRDETDSQYRRICTTTDLGVNWSIHPTNGKVYEQSACEASLLHVDASANVLGRDVLLMSNPQGTSGWRSAITIQASLDKGNTWTHKYLLDPGGSLGYSCLTMIDENTVGVLYESPRASIMFQAVPLSDIIKE